MLCRIYYPVFGFTVPIVRLFDYEITVVGTNFTVPIVRLFDYEITVVGTNFTVPIVRLFDFEITVVGTNFLLNKSLVTRLANSHFIIYSIFWSRCYFLIIVFV